MTEEEFPDCFGFFMSGKNCSNCYLLDRCYRKWKQSGEPKLFSKKLPMIRENKKCNCS